MAKARSIFLVGMSFVVGIGLLIWGLSALSAPHGNTTPTTSGSSAVTTASLTTPGKQTVVWFSATWCNICRQMRPFIAPTVARHADTLVLSEYDVDRESNLAQQYGVRGTPTFVLLDDAGRELSRRAGYMSEAEFERFITAES